MNEKKAGAAEATIKYLGFFLQCRHKIQKAYIHASHRHVNHLDDDYDYTVNSAFFYGSLEDRVYETRTCLRITV